MHTDGVHSFVAQSLYLLPRLLHDVLHVFYCEFCRCEVILSMALHPNQPCTWVQVNYWCRGGKLFFRILYSPGVAVQHR